MVDKAMEAIEKGNLTVEQLESYANMIWSMQVHEPKRHSSDNTSSDTSINTATQPENEDKRKRLLT